MATKAIGSKFIRRSTSVTLPAADTGGWQTGYSLDGLREFVAATLDARGDLVVVCGDDDALTVQVPVG